MSIRNLNFESWFSFDRFGRDLTEEDKDTVIKLCEGLRDSWAPGPMGPEDAFDALCRYSRSRYSYAAVGSGVAAGLRSGQFNCGGAADLVVGVVLYLSGQDMDVDRAYGLSGGLRAVVTPRIEQAGVIIENNLTGGGGRMLFSGGHTIAMIGDDQFDLITGRRDHRIDFLLPNKLPDTAGKSTFGCDIDGVARVFTQVDGKTTEGLSKFNVVPPI